MEIGMEQRWNKNDSCFLMTYKQHNYGMCPCLFLSSDRSIQWRDQKDVGKTSYRVYVH